MTVIDVCDVRKAYDGRAVVDGVSFAVEEGEIFGVLGPNGAGKTTLVECIEGLRRPDAGVRHPRPGADRGHHPARGGRPGRDGRGFDPAAVPDPGPDGSSFGLVAMRQRVAGHRGVLAVESAPGAASPVRILIADDPPVVRGGLRGMFAGEADLEVVGDAANGREAVGRVRLFDPDVVLMDLRMPEMDGVSAIRTLAADGAAARVLVLTTYDTDRDVLAAIDAGATGYLLKDAPREDLFRAVRAAARGETVLAPSVAAQLVGQVRDPRPATLTDRELEILRLVAGVRPTSRRRSGCSSARPRSGPTCSTPTPSSASTTGRRRSPPPTTGGC